MRKFGTLEDGRDVDAILIGDDDGLQAEVLTYGAILRRLTCPVRDQRRDLVLHLDALEDYVRDRAYVGALVGRFGNRIAGGKFSIDGQEYQVTANEGANHLHGGALGFGKRLWRVLDATDNSVVLAYSSPAGEEGYPGALEATISIVAAGHSMAIAITATSDAPTPVNLTYHPYFNLAPGQDATRQLLRIPADHYLPVREGLIPTGEFAPVEGTAFDFRKSRPLAPPDPQLADPQLKLGGGYDHCWVLRDDADCSCELTAPDGEVRLTMLGSGPGLQFYNGQFLSRSHAALGSGVILEPQGLPNAPNERGFPNSILRPGATYGTGIEYHVAEP